MMRTNFKSQFQLNFLFNRREPHYQKVLQGFKVTLGNNYLDITLLALVLVHYVNRITKNKNRYKIF